LLIARHELFTAKRTATSAHACFCDICFIYPQSEGQDDLRNCLWLSAYPRTFGLLSQAPSDGLYAAEDFKNNRVCRILRRKIIHVQSPNLSAMPFVAGGRMYLLQPPSALLSHQVIHCRRMQNFPQFNFMIGFE
jgi:hypothetical protein